MVQFETDPIARDQHIQDLVGLAPYYGALPPRAGRPYLARSETVNLINGVKVGDADATQKLVASRLVWIYDDFAQIEEVTARTDIGLEDVMQIGCLATIEAAKQVDPMSQVNYPAQLHLITPGLMARHLLEGRLIPNVHEGGRKVVHNAGNHNLERKDRIADLAMPAGLMPIDRDSSPVSTPEKTVFASPEVLKSLIVQSMNSLSERDREIVFARFYLNAPEATGTTKAFDSIAKEHGLTQQRINQIVTAALQKMAIYDEHKGGNLLLSVLGDEINYGLGSEASSEQALAKLEEALVKQEAWLAEIKAKQDRGDVVFYSSEGRHSLETHV
jgi:hypothetical protein